MRGRCLPLSAYRQMHSPPPALSPYRTKDADCLPDFGKRVVPTNDCTARPWRGGQELLHPGIVVGAIENHDLCACELAHNSGSGLEQMRILVRIGHNAGDRNPLAADLAGDVA